MDQIQIIPSQVVKSFLGTFQPIPVPRIFAILSRVRTMTAIYQVYAEFHPKEVQRVLGAPSDWFTVGLHDPSEIETRFVGALGELFPIDEGYADEMLFGGFSGNDFGGFCVAGCGPCLSWDIVGDIIDDPTQAEPLLSLPLFLGAIWNDFNAASWRKLAKRFHWPFNTHPDLPEGKWHFSPSKLRKLLLRKNMKKYWTAWQVINEDTGIIFFDTNPNEESSIPEPIEATAESIRGLARLWKKSEPMYKDYIDTLKEVAAHPAVLTKLFNLMLQTIIFEGEEENEQFKDFDQGGSYFDH